MPPTNSGHIGPPAVASEVMQNTWVETDPDILGSNISCLKSILSPGTEPVFVVKANAYGHGLEPTARRARESGVRWFAVSHIEEAAVLRKVVPDAEIIVVGVLQPEEVGQAIACGAVTVVVGQSHAIAMEEAATAMGSRLRCHIKIDTGMGRLGFLWNEGVRIREVLDKCKSLSIEGVCTHFASAGEQDRSFADEQFRRFCEIRSVLRDSGLDIGFNHISNSGGIVADESWDMDAVRAGILLYGYPPLEGSCPARREKLAALKPFLQWKTRVVQVKSVPPGFPVSYDSAYVTHSRTSIAILDVGYSDGYFRSLSNKGVVIAGGRRCPVVGRVTMNLTAIDLGSESEVRPGDEVVLVGEQDGESIWADELADLAGTISYEILTNIRTDKRRAVCH